MPDFPYARGRNWVNEENSPTPSDPVADDVWFEAVEAAIHQGQDHEKTGSGGGGTALVFQATDPAEYSLAPGATSKVIPFTEVVIGDAVNLSSSPSGFVFPAAGVYRVDFRVSGAGLPSAVGEQINVRLQKNGLYDATLNELDSSGQVLWYDQVAAPSTSRIEILFRGFSLVSAQANDFVALAVTSNFEFDFSSRVDRRKFEVIRHA